MSVTSKNVPSALETRRIVARACMDAARVMLQHWTPSDHGGVSKQAAIAAAHEVFGYVPQSVWSHTVKIPFWGQKDCGRPDASPSGTKSATKSATKRTATKRTTTKVPTKRTATKVPTKRATKVPTKSAESQRKDDAIHASARVASPATVAALHASLPTS